MRYYCSVCDKTKKLKSKNKHFESFTHEERKKFIQINHTIQNPSFLK